MAGLRPGHLTALVTPRCVPPPSWPPPWDAVEQQGSVDYDALIEGRPQPSGGEPGSFELYRIGDAVASRNIHAAMRKNRVVLGAGPN